MDLNLFSITAILLLGAMIYIAGMLLYYVFFFDDILILGREDSLTQVLLRLVNPLRSALGKMPVWDVPQDVAEQEMLRVAVDCLSHIQWALNRHRPAHGRVISNATTLNYLARKLLGDMVEALWSLQWTREITVKLNQLDQPEAAHRIARIQAIEQRDLQRIDRSMDSLVSLATRLTELGSQVKNSDLEDLLAEFGEVLTQLEEDALALEEVRKTTLI